MNTPNIPIKRCGLVAIIGPVNAGKSTLVNQLVGQKVTIVSPKAQTTRMRVMGIAIAENTQLVLADTPGLFNPHDRFEKAMVQAVWDAQTEADQTVVVLEARPTHVPKNRALLEDIVQKVSNITLVLNKIDLLPREELLHLTQQLTQGLNIDNVFMISALKNDRVDDLKQHLAQCMPAQEWLFPAEDITNMPARLYAAEVTREKILHALYQEVPHELWIETEQWQDQPNGSAKVYQTIHVQTLGQKKIIIGKGGQLLKKIGQQARTELTEALGHPIHLFLHIKISPKWQEKRDVYQELGLRY